MSEVVETHNEEVKRRRNRELADIRDVMATKAGRRFIWRLMEEGNIFRCCFTGNSSTFYNEGKREMMLPFFQDIMEACPNMWTKAQKENGSKGEVSNGRQSPTD